MTQKLSLVLEQLSKSNDINKEHKFICQIKNKRTLKTKNDRKSMLLTLADGDCEIEGAIFPDNYAKYKNDVAVGSLVEVRGFLSDDATRLSITHLKKVSDRQCHEGKDGLPQLVRGHVGMISM